MKKLWILLLLTSFLYSCDSDDTNTKVADAMNFDNVDMMTAGSINTGGSESMDTEYLTYTRSISDEGNNTVDLVAYRFDSNEEIILNEGISKDEMDCLGKGCLVHPHLNYVAWAQIPAGASAYKLYVAPIDQNSRKVKVEEKRELGSDVINYQFTDTRIVYSMIKDPSAREGMAIKYEPIDGSAPAEEVALVSANGGFKTTKYDDLLILISTPDLSSMTVSFRNLANGLSQDLWTFGEAGGTGSEFAAGSSPISFANDGTYLAILTNNDLMWRLNILEASEAPPPPSVKELFPVRNSMDVCSKEDPYRFTQVLNQPVFNQDSSAFYLLWNGDCSQRSAQINRLDYEIVKFQKDVSAEPINITKFPRVSHWSNQDVGEFVLSKDDRKIAFTASRPNKASSQSIWLIANPETEVDAPTYDCSRGTPQLDLTGVTRCEFLTYDKSTAVVKYQALQFHKAAAF